jgi:hypothetical protein
MGIILCPVFYFKHTVSAAGFCPRLQVEPTQMAQIERVSICLRTQADE